jgi:hypothetical protein
VTIDVPRLRKALEYVTAHPEDWSQEEWLVGRTKASCGTAGCLAGRVVLQDGWSPLLELRGGQVCRTVVDDAGNAQRVRTLARDLLDLTDAQATVLFYGRNNLLDLWLIAEYLTYGDVQSPVEVLDRYAPDDLATARRRLAKRVALYPSSLRSTARHGTGDAVR